MAGEPVVIIPRGEIIVTDLKKQRWIVGASLNVDGSRDIYAVARCDNSEPENYPAVMVFKPHDSDPQTLEMRASICNPKTMEKWKKSKGIRHLGVTPILGAGSYKYNDKMHPYIITQRYAKNLQQLLASNDKGFILPTVYRVIGQMFYALEYMHSQGQSVKFDISSDKLLQSFTNPNDIYLDVIDYGKTEECLTYRSGKFPVGSPHGNIENILYIAFSWLKLPLPWQHNLKDEAQVNKQKIKAFAHVERFLRCVFGPFTVLNPIQNIMIELASSDVTKQPDYKNLISFIGEGARNLAKVQYVLDNSLNFDEELKLRQINKKSRQNIPSFFDDSSDEKDSKAFKKMVDAKGNAEDSPKKTAVPVADTNTSNTVASNNNATTRNPSPILSFGKKDAKATQNVATPSAATTSTARSEPSKATETSKNEVTESQNEQQRTIPKSASEVGASTSSNVQPEKNITTSDSIGACKCKAGVVNDRVNAESIRRSNNTIQSPDGSESHSKHNLEDESRKEEKKTGNCKIELVDVSSGDENSTIGKPNLKAEKPVRKVKKESLDKNKDAEKEKKRKSRNKSTNSEDSDSNSREKSLKKKMKKKLLEKKKKEKDNSDSASSDSDDDSSDSNDDGKSKSKKKKRKKHRSASSDSGDADSNFEKKKVKRKKSKKTINYSDSDVSLTRDSNKKESRRRSSKRRQDRDSDLSPPRDSIRIDRRSGTSSKRSQYSDSDLNSPRHSSRRDSRSRRSSKRRKDSDHDLSPHRFSENKNESSSSRSRKRSPSKYPEMHFSRPRDNSYSTKSHNNSGFSDCRYQSDSSSFRPKMFHNFRNSAHDQSNLTYGQTSKNTHSRFHNTNYGQHYDPPRSSYSQHYVRGNYYAKFRPPYMRGGSSQSRDGRMFLNHHETQPGQRWNSISRSDGRSTSPASTVSSNFTGQRQTYNEKYTQEETQLRNVNEEENGFAQVSLARDYRSRDFKNNLADDPERYNELVGIEKLNRAEGRDDRLRKGLPLEKNKPAARDTDGDFELELRTVGQEDPMLAYEREDEVNEDQREPD